jgi:hypothetical protein
VIYIFDTGPLIWLFRHYYYSRFPTLWEKFDELIVKKHIISVREVYNEIQKQEDNLSHWAKNHRNIFYQPSVEELNFVNKILKITHFQAIVNKQALLEGKPVADPFVIAKAKIENGCVVTTETLKKNAAKIPNICEYFKISCINLEKFMEQENWIF